MTGPRGDSEFCFLETLHRGLSSIKNCLMLIKRINQYIHHASKAKQQFQREISLERNQTKTSVTIIEFGLRIASDQNSLLQ